MEDRRTGVSEPNAVRLDSWKDIAAFFGRDVRTVRRWETDHGLPVRRVPGHARGRVFAYLADLQAWLDTASSATSESDRWVAEPPPVAAADASDVIGSDAGVVVAVREAASAPMPAAAARSSLRGETGDANLRLGPGAGLDAKSVSGRPVRWRPLVAAAALALCALGALLAASHWPAAAPHHVAAAQAQDLYLRGRYALSLRTEGSLNDAVALFTQALVIDPKYAAAYAGLADSHILLRQFGNVPDAEAFAKALAANERAVALDPASVEALRTHAFLLNWWMWDFPAAEREFKRAIALDPLDVQTHHWYATALYANGHFGEALAEIDVARRLQPDAVAVLANRGLLLAAIDPQAALNDLLQLEKTNPNFPAIHRYLGLVHFQLGQSRAAVEEMHQAAALHGDAEAVTVIDRASAALAQGGERDMLQTMGEGLGRMADHYTLDPLKPAYYYARLGNAERTLHYLTLAFERHQADFIEVNSNRVYAFLRGMAPFEALRRRAGLPAPAAPASPVASGSRPPR